MLGIDLQEDATLVKNWGNSHGLSFPLLIDPDRSVWNQYGMGYIPHNVVIDPNMVVRYTNYGYNESAIINVIETWLPIETTVTYNFSQQGWYLISLPVTPTDNSLNNLFPTALGAYAFDHTTGGYYSANSLDPQKGYWLLIPSPTTSTISGTPLNNYTEHYEIGWHLIGTVMGTVNFADPDDNPDGSVFAAYGWDSAAGQYFVVYPAGTGVLEPSAGYWLAVIQPCDLTIGSGSISNNAAEVIKDDINAFYQKFGSQPPVPPFIADHNLTQLLQPEEMKLENYPNPFNSQTTIKYRLSHYTQTQIIIYNIMGRKIKTLMNGNQSAGSHEVVWDGSNDFGDLVSSGIYVYKIITPRFGISNKMLLLK